MEYIYHQHFFIEIVALHIWNILPSNHTCNAVLDQPLNKQILERRIMLLSSFGHSMRYCILHILTNADGIWVFHAYRKFAYVHSMHTLQCRKSKSSMVVCFRKQPKGQQDKRAFCVSCATLTGLVCLGQGEVKEQCSQ